jgi:hypothetical protein
MIQRCEDLCFTLKPRQAIGIVGERPRQDFQRDVAAELCIPRALDLAHAPGAQGRQNLIRAEACAGR